MEAKDNVIRLVPDIAGDGYAIQTEAVLDGAKDAELKVCLVLGVTAEGDEYFAGTTGDKGTIVLLLERFRNYITMGRIDW